MHVGTLSLLLQLVRVALNQLKLVRVGHCSLGKQSVSVACLPVSVVVALVISRDLGDVDHLIKDVFNLKAVDSLSLLVVDIHQFSIHKLVVLHFIQLIVYVLAEVWNLVLTQLHDSLESVVVESSRSQLVVLVDVVLHLQVVGIASLLE